MSQLIHSNTVITERHTFQFNEDLQELRVNWNGQPTSLRFFSIEELHILRALLESVLPARKEEGGQRNGKH